ncbi:D-alanine--D-alanine ligase [Arcobacter sp. FWKO B]|uniref:D-alanine--D-alanine ligase n=1 Tax=Arcobacter sp. FWKO B TaxID=2593672 RepID=UPI0018A676AE|nr:D-alanine--D-alanine ligase [Arcobacter sp. FWKO B]QOG11530.1 D-alanine--D-alanine ligase [Arcobacter sp. FWKO B]
MNKIAVFFGGMSYEHEISIVSAIAMKKVIKKELIFIFVDQNREFFLIPNDKMKSTLFSTASYKKEQKLEISNNGFYKRGLFGTTKIDFDLALNLIHGGDGEDGVVASLFNFFDIPFIGPRTQACVLSFDKYITKMFANEIGVKTVEFTKIDKNNREIKGIDFPMIIKPCRLGSSIGVSVVKDVKELEYALDVAFEFDNDVIVEPFINGVKEYNLAGTMTQSGLAFSIIEEPQKKEFLDFEKKYLDFGRSEQVSSADLGDELINSLKENFAKIYNPFFCGAIIRCDFFVIDDEVYLNEINPIPGSMANYLFEDFNSVISSIKLPVNKKIKINYEYVNKIKSAKGKL